MSIQKTVDSIIQKALTEGVARAERDALYEAEFNRMLEEHKETLANLPTKDGYVYKKTRKKT